MNLTPQGLLANANEGVDVKLGLFLPKFSLKMETGKKYLYVSHSCVGLC